MEKESFMSPEVAAILNKAFIPIKLDREERPDIDDVYMNYVQATTGSGGWPLNVFLTPDLEPVFGGTYWPGPHSSASSTLGGEGQVTFIEILEKLRDVWQTQQLRCCESAKDITRQLQEFAEEGTYSKQRGAGAEADEEEDLEVELLEEAYKHFASRYDPVNGGFSRAPKFPTPANLSFLVNLSRFSNAVADIVGYEECAHALEMAIKTLISISRGGIHDHIGHGFARYSVTADWSLPHFEKMLYDQAQLLGVYADAFDSTHDPELLGAMYDVAAYITSPPVLSPTGGFHSSEDADSLPTPSDTDKREGAFYVWTHKEFKQILGQRDADVCARHWGVLPDGNVERVNDPHDEFINQNVLNIQTTPGKLAKEFGLSEEEVVRIIKASTEKLREYRESKRVRPALDDKIIVAWNGLAIGALAKCSVVLDNVDRIKAQEFRLAAENAAKFIRQSLFDPASGQLWRIYRGDERGDTPGFADDYAYLISGLIDLYEATFDDSYLQFAEQLQRKSELPPPRIFFVSNFASSNYLRIPEHILPRPWSSRNHIANNDHIHIHIHRHHNTPLLFCRLLHHPFDPPPNPHTSSPSLPSQSRHRCLDAITQRRHRSKSPPPLHPPRRRHLQAPGTRHRQRLRCGDHAAPIPLRRVAGCRCRAGSGG